MAEWQPVAEKWFLRRGLTALLNDTSARTDVSRRAAPALIGLFLLALTGPTLASGGPVGTNVAIGVVSLLLTWVGANLIRRRPPFARIDRVGKLERAVFVFVPTLLAAVSQYRPIDVPELGHIPAGTVRIVVVVAVFVLQVVLLIAVLAAVRFGVVSILTWMTRELLGSLSSAAVTLSRTLPLLLGVVMFVFLSSEVWQTLGRLDSFAFLIAMGMLVGLSAAFLSSRTQLDVDELATFADRADFEAALADSPLMGFADRVALPATTPLDRQQESNLRLVATISRLAIASVVSLAVFAFFLVFGFLAINPTLVQSWVGGPPETIWVLTTSQHTFGLTWEHVRVATFLAVFAGFYYSVVSATDPALRAGVRDTSADTVRTACAARLALLAQDGQD